VKLSTRLEKREKDPSELFNLDDQLSAKKIEGKIQKVDVPHPQLDKGSA